MSFTLQKILRFMRFYLLVIDLSACTNVFCSKTPFPYQNVQGYYPLFLLSGSVYLVLNCYIWGHSHQQCTSFKLLLIFSNPRAGQSSNLCHHSSYGEFGSHPLYYDQSVHKIKVEGRKIKKETVAREYQLGKMILVLHLHFMVTKVNNTYT